MQPDVSAAIAPTITEVQDALVARLSGECGFDTDANPYIGTNVTANVFDAERLARQLHQIECLFLDADDDQSEEAAKAISKARHLLGLVEPYDL